MTGAYSAPGKQRRELQFNAARKGERAFRAAENMREVEIVASRTERIEIVSADPALQLGEIVLDVCRVFVSKRQQLARHRQKPRLRRQIVQVAVGTAEMLGRAVRQDGVDREYVLAGIAVAQRARAARIVAHHAADGRA